MAQPRRDDTIFAPIPSVPVPSGPIPSFPETAGEHRPGGPVGEMHADLARRLVLEGSVADVRHDKQPGERMARFVSITAGRLALLVAYAGAAVLILR